MPILKADDAGENHMAFWNSWYRRWGTALVIFVAAAFALLIGRYLQMRANYDLCEVAESNTLSGPGGQTIEMDTRFCDPLAGDPGTIVVRFRPAGSAQGKIVFAYNPADNSADAGPRVSGPPWYPQIAWRGSNRVLISISRISQIQRQRFEVDEVHFIYKVGKVDYPEAP